MKKTKNSFGIRFLTKGPPNLIATINALIAMGDALRLCTSYDIDARVAPEGTLASLRNPQGGGGISRPAGRTLLVYDASTSTPKAAKISVTYGQINNVTPTVGGSSLRIFPAPTLTVVSGVIYLEATVDAAGVLTALEIKNADTVPEPTSTKGYLVLAEVTVTDGAITALNPACWNIFRMAKCGGTQYDWFGFGV